jgi:hypothetical protein
LKAKEKEKSDVRLPALFKKPGVRIQDIFHQKTFHIPIPVINVDPIRQKQILPHPPFQLAINNHKLSKPSSLDGFVKSRRCCHCERSEAISLAVTA